VAANHEQIDRFHCQSRCTIIPERQMPYFARFKTFLRILEIHAARENCFEELAQRRADDNLKFTRQLFSRRVLKPYNSQLLCHEENHVQ
jgi:hypothetical protein